MKVVVIGGGPAGMMASITAAEAGHEVVLIEKMNMLGKKLLITGKGRCNITSSLDIDEFIKNVPGNGKFLYSCFKNYTNLDIIDFLKKQGLEVKEERGNRIFPVTDKSVDVLRCFEKRIRELNIKVMLNTRVNQILTHNGVSVGVELENMDKLLCDKVILATGGKSYPLTGSTGDGYVMAKNLGHTLTKIRPSLVGLEIYEKEVCKSLQGLSLRNVKMKLADVGKNKIIYEDFGEMLFTHFGVSGPMVLSSSAHLLRYKNVEELLRSKKIELVIDLKPALDTEKLDLRIRRDFDEFKNKEFKNSLDRLLPQKLIEEVIKRTDICPTKKVNEITKLERRRLVNVLKEFKITVKDFGKIEEAIVTSGGVATNEINPKTMESKIIKNLYFAGEVIDVDAYTGGFNLQIAYSTGVTAGELN